MIIESNILKLKINDSVYVPSAAEINTVASGQKVYGILAEPDTSELSSSGLSFSKLPARLMLRLYKKDFAVGYEIRGIRNGIEVSVQFKKFGGADHAVFGNRWHYLGADYHALEAMMLSDETTTETIPFNVYLSLLKAEDSFSSLSIVNEVPNSFEIAESSVLLLSA